MIYNYEHWKRILAIDLETK